MDIENILVMLKRCCVYFLWELFIRLGAALRCHLSSPMKTIINCNGNKTWRKQTRPMSWITLEKYQNTSFDYSITYCGKKRQYSEKATCAPGELRPYARRPTCGLLAERQQLCINIYFLLYIAFVTLSFAAVILWLGRKAEKVNVPAGNLYFIKRQLD